MIVDNNNICTTCFNMLEYSSQLVLLSCYVYTADILIQSTFKYHDWINVWLHSQHVLCLCKMHVIQSYSPLNGYNIRLNIAYLVYDDKATTCGL